jgi:hypothetical protein
MRRRRRVRHIRAIHRRRQTRLPHRVPDRRGRQEATEEERHGQVLHGERGAEVLDGVEEDGFGWVGGVL